MLSHYLPAGDPALSVYAACVRVSQALVLFLTAVSYMFSPFVADLYERDEHDRLNSLFKSDHPMDARGARSRCCCCSGSLRAPCSRCSASDYDAGTSWLRILLIGQIVNVSWAPPGSS